MPKEYVNPLTGEVLSREAVRDIFVKYGSYDEWINVLKRNPTTRAMLATDPKANGGNVQARRIMNEQAKARAGAGAKIMDVALDATHYIPSTQIAADIVDSYNAKGDVNGQTQNGLAAESTAVAKAAPKIAASLEASGEYGAEMAKTLLKGSSLPGRVVGALDDVKNTAKMVKDIVTTPNKDYVSHTVDAEKPMKWGDFLRD